MHVFIDKLVAEHQFKATDLLAILRAIQARYHYIPPSAIAHVAKVLALSVSHIIGVIEFYSFFHLHPQGDYDLLISDSITDAMLGKQALMDLLSEKLSVAVGAVRADGLVSLANTSCTGLCDQGPAGLVNGHPLTQLTPARIDLITTLIHQHIPVEDWPAELFAITDNIKKTDLLLTQPMPLGSALAAACTRGFTETLAEIERSGLRGRGGAGFKTAMKWQFCREEHADNRYVICNADEGEPGTFKDRVLLNQYAHQVFEGMTIAAAIVGATQGFLYLRGEYSFLYEKLAAILHARCEAGLLGENILGQGFSFAIKICLGAGAYICGEESALIESLEGNMGIPRNRPPYPVTHGYLGKPTIVNNVETFLAAAHITLHGSATFASMGTQQSKGTKILSICGDCLHPGIYEFVFGTTIKDILETCGATEVLGVQIGGPSGVFISAQEVDRRLAFEDVATGGSFIVFNQTRNILDSVTNFTHFFAHESCGFCTPCRVGTSLLKQQIDKIVGGHGSAGDIVALEELCQLVKSQSHCGLGQTAANPILSTLERYPELYQQLLKKISYEPGFDLDAALATARHLTQRDDAAAHLAQIGEDHE